MPIFIFPKQATLVDPVSVFCTPVQHKNSGGIGVSGNETPLVLIHSNNLIPIVLLVTATSKVPRTRHSIGTLVDGLVKK